MQPIAFCHRRPRPALGRRGVHLSAAASAPAPTAGRTRKGDRILIFEDTDGDGKFDKRTVFMEGLNLVSGLEVGFGGVWVGAAPYLLFIPIDDGDDKPDGPPKILLDGWGYQDTHETLNTFTWGPDGWLYGCHGVFTHSRVGKPGTPDKDRIPHQRRRLALPSDAARLRGLRPRHEQPVGPRLQRPRQAFFIEPASSRTCSTSSRAAAISARRARTSTRTPTTTSRRSPITGTTSAPRRTAATTAADAAGGGHAHCGLMFYLGGAWPEEYRGKLFMDNIHGHRLNVDILERRRAPATSATTARTSCWPTTRWSQLINLQYGPDGNVYLIDWYDKQACHLPQPEDLGPHQRPHLQDQLQGHEAGAEVDLAEVHRRGAGEVSVERQRLVRAARAADLAGTSRRARQAGDRPRS